VTTRAAATPLGDPPGRPGDPGTLRILVCGEPARGDDSVGPMAVDAVLASLAADLRPMLDVRRCGGPDPIDLLDQPAGQPCLIVDAVVGIPPGEIITVPLETLGSVADGLIPASTHTVPLPDALTLAAAVRGHPVSGLFVGLGGARFGLGEPPSPDVVGAMPRFEAAIREAIGALLAP
jgi:hydrogenase maturation protease